MVVKAKRKPFKVNNQGPREVLDAVSTDTTGITTPADIDGNVYLQLVVDEASRYTQRLPLTKKSDADRAILQEIKKLELAVGKARKRYNAVNSKDQHTKKLICELKAKRTQVTTTSPHTSQHNAIAKRRFGPNRSERYSQPTELPWQAAILTRSSGIWLA